MADFKSGFFMYMLGGLVGLFVIAQSIFFLSKALKRGKELGLDVLVLKRTAVSAAVFAILPSVSILLALVTLSYALGLPLPWIRLSVLGAVTYELPAASAALNALGSSISEPVTNASAFSAIAWVMTLGCISPLIIIPLFLKKIQKGILSIQKKDNRWGELFMTALFLGMISAFLGMGVSGGILPVLTLFASAAIMVCIGILIKKMKIRWLEDFAMPLSMLGAMALAIWFAQLLPPELLPANLWK
ncbi:MAG TPA: DUF5058 family protein [Treponemataceae bacterium]|nr:DUF5058 family protein [Treponemataceae bacterium]